MKSPQLWWEWHFHILLCEEVILQIHLWNSIFKSSPFLYTIIIFLLTPYWKCFLWVLMFFLCFINLNYHYPDFNTKKSELVDILQKADNVITKVVLSIYTFIYSSPIYLSFYLSISFLSIKEKWFMDILQKADNVITKVKLSISKV